MNTSMRQMYHVTFQKNVKSIQTKGLLTGRKPVWTNRFGGKLGEKGKLYLISDWYEAIRLACRLEWDTKKPIVIIEVNATNALIERDDHMENMFDAWFKTSQSIVPEHIGNVHALTLEMKRSVVENDKKRFACSGN